MGAVMVYNSIKKTQLVLKCSFFAAIFLFYPHITFSNESENIKNLFKKLDNRFSEISQSKKIATMGLDSMDLFLPELLKKTPSAQTIMRVNTNGLIINVASRKTLNIGMKDVSDQKWFTHVKSSHTPYYGTSRDSSGGTFLFCAWPIINKDSIFSGIITAKLISSKILQEAGISSAIPVKINLNENSIYKQNWTESGTFTTDSIKLNRKSILFISTVNYNGIANTASDSNSQLSKTVTKSAQLPAEPSKETTPSKKNTNLEPPPVNASNTPIQVYTSDFDETPEKPSTNRAIPYFILSGILIIALAILFTKWKARKKSVISANESKKLFKMQADETYKKFSNTTSVTDNCKIKVIADCKDNPSDIINNAETVKINMFTSTNDISLHKKHDDTAKDYEEETKEFELLTIKNMTSDQNTLPSVEPIEESVTEPITQMHLEQVSNPESTMLTDNDDFCNQNTENMTKIITDDSAEKMRQEIYREIHQQVIQWVAAESERLSHRLDELTIRINSLDKQDPQFLKNVVSESESLSEDISQFKNKFTINNSD
jgi:hypothetical protein